MEFCVFGDGVEGVSANRKPAKKKVRTPPCALPRATAIFPVAVGLHLSLVRALLSSLFLFRGRFLRARNSPSTARSRARHVRQLRHALRAGAARRGRSGADCTCPARSSRAVGNDDAERCGLGVVYCCLGCCFDVCCRDRFCLCFAIGHGRDGLPCALRPRGKHARCSESELLREI